MKKYFTDNKYRKRFTPDNNIAITKHYGLVKKSAVLLYNAKYM